MQVAPYGPGLHQYGEWWVPPASDPRPLVVLVHGGFWRPIYDLSLEHDVAQALAAQGFLVWNVEYSPAGSPWPSTLTDVAAAYDFALADPRVDASRVAVVGHSAGGHLALWLGAMRAPALVVAQAPVACLTRAWEQRLGNGAVEAFVGGTPSTHPSRYAEADPLLLPAPTRAVLIHAPDDEVVPMEQSRTYADAKGATVAEVAGGHFCHLDPDSEAVGALIEQL